MYHICLGDWYLNLYSAIIAELNVEIVLYQEFLCHYPPSKLEIDTQTSASAQESYHFCVSEDMLPATVCTSYYITFETVVIL